MRVACRSSPVHRAAEIALSRRFGLAGERRRRRRPSAVEEETTGGLVQGLAVVKAIRCRSDCTRPLSWLGSKSFGVHPHTKGALCSAGGHRR
jgi:hypothetical protein